MNPVNPGPIISAQYMWVHPLDQQQSNGLMVRMGLHYTTGQKLESMGIIAMVMVDILIQIFIH